MPQGAGLIVANACVAAIALGIALWLRPWRTFGPAGPPWPWLAAWGALPLWWGLDRIAAAPLAPPVSGASLLVLLAGWPLALIAQSSAAALIVVAGPLGWAEGLDRLVWLGIVPSTLVLVSGAATRRWLPHHLFVYIFARAFLGTLVAASLAGAAALAVHQVPSGTSPSDLLLARVLAAFGEATLTGMLVAILVAFRPEWLATYTDRLYLPARPRDPPAD